MIRTRTRCRVVGLSVLGLIIAALVHTWLLMGLFVPLTIEGPSMAETLYGRHRRMDCRDCGFRFAWQAARGGARSRITCPNCGCEQTPPDAESEIPGDHVLVARSMPALRAPKRWEPVVVRRPGRESELVVKRLVGLPGETVELRHGDLYIDGRLERKTLRQQRATAVLVHDAHWMPSSLPEEERPWQEAGGKRRWTWRDGCFTHSKVERLAPPAAAAPSAGLANPATREETVDWLIFGPRRRNAGSADVSPVPVTNLLGYNQACHQRSETVHAVYDVMLSIELDQCRGPGCLYLAATDGREEFCVRIDPNRRQTEVFRDAAPALPPIAIDDLRGGLPGARIELSLFDRQFLLAINHRTRVEIPLSEGGIPATVYHPLALGSDNLDLRIGAARVYRDIHYAPSCEPGVQASGTWRLAGDEYFLLGDNTDFSDDSRLWHPDRPVTSRSLVGEPIAVHWPSYPVRWGALQFQVPDLRRIRYIR